MNEQEEAPGFILPIICNHCGCQINLSMEFNLVPEKEEKEENKE
jgi:hypothetical protein